VTSFIDNFLKLDQQTAGAKKQRNSLAKESLTKQTLSTEAKEKEVQAPKELQIEEVEKKLRKNASWPVIQDSSFDNGQKGLGFFKKPPSIAVVERQVRQAGKLDLIDIATKKLNSIRTFSLPTY